MKPALRTENLSKQYTLGALATAGYQTLRENLVQTALAPWRWLARGRDGKATGVANEGETLWALRDVTLEIQPGDVVGIIGRNGAGKSTLLKVFSRITEPTSGRAYVRGRIGSLLEVGTGFHPELTGRENIYLNGSVLGMRRREIDRKFDEIVAFAGVEQFLDTPVKHYSSGMYVRLAFAVAAHLEPEILVVDEVLSVGDADFQKKCLGKMQAVAQGGRTVLFVSHNIGVLKTLCDKGLLLDRGRLVTQGAIEDVIETYLRSLEAQAAKSLSARTDRRGKGEIRLHNIHVSMGPEFPPNTLVVGRPAEFVFELNQVQENIDLSFIIYDHRGTAVSTLDTWRRGPCDQHVPEVGKRAICRIDELPLRSGRYYLSASIACNKELQDQIDGVVFFDVQNGEFRGRTFPYPNIPGVVCIDHAWTRPF
jgi:lipopolysaccharide transport system ATP-binding protein